MSHQLIIFENPPQQPVTRDIESNQPVTIIKPSSLNYKVSLSEALASFVKKSEGERPRKYNLLTETEDQLEKGTE
jgi:hypothetical protein